MYRAVVDEPVDLRRRTRPEAVSRQGSALRFFREDYDHPSREHTILSTPEGWVQSERKRKLTKDGQLVSYELGYIIYRKSDDAPCERTVTDPSALEQER